jgi:hypothetical protein
MPHASFYTSHSFLGLLFSTAVSMVCRKGSVNYKNEVLLQLIGKILPNGEYGWQAVAMAYQERTKEEALCNYTEVKKHWINNLCNNMKKPTGRMGEDGNQINQCIAIEKKFMKKTYSRMLGFTLDEGSANPETENTGRGGLEGGLTESTLTWSTMTKATRLPIMLLWTFHLSLLSAVLPAVLPSNSPMSTTTTRYGNRKQM